MVEGPINTFDRRNEHPVTSHAKVYDEGLVHLYIKSPIRDGLSAVGRQSVSFATTRLTWRFIL